MAIVAKQVGILAIFALIGYVLARIGKVKAEHSQILSTLVVYACYPCTVFKTFSNQFNVPYLTEKYPSILISAVLQLSSDPNGSPEK